MNVENARGGLAALNVALTIGLVFLGWFTFLKHHEPPPGDRVPSYLPTNHQLPLNAKKADPINEFSVIWQGLDKALPPPAPPPPPPPREPAPEDLEAKFKLILVAIDPEDPKLNSCIIEWKQPPPGTPDGERQHSLAVGEELFAPFQGFRCVKVEAKDEANKGRIAIVTLEDTKKLGGPGGHPVSTIKLTPAKD